MKFYGFNYYLKKREYCLNDEQHAFVNKLQKFFLNLLLLKKLYIAPLINNKFL